MKTALGDFALDRRTFLLACVACVSGCAAVPRYVVPPGEAGWPLRVPASALGEEGYVVVSRSGGAPLLLRVEGEACHAVELLCTHRACEVRPRRDKLVCPCHGSEFDLGGAVLRGPADAPLRRHPARRAEDGSFVIEEG